jgi:malate dehydrogenase
MKLGIIGGAGLLGSTTAFVVGMKDILDEIKLVDLNKSVLGSHVMDMGQALLPISKTKITKADYSDLSDCDIIVITASLPERKVDNRNEYLQGNLGIMKPICESLREFTKEAIVLTCTNPIDVFNYVTWKLLGWNKNKILGFDLNDTLRLKWSVASVTGLEYGKLNGYCIGEHGDGQVRLFDQMTYEGRPINLTDEQAISSTKLTADWFRTYQELESKRTTGWTSAVNLAEIIEAIATDSGKVIPCSIILTGENGYEGVSMGMPVSLGKDGVKEIALPELTTTQKEQLNNTAEKIKGLINSVIQ